MTRALKTLIVLVAFSLVAAGCFSLRGFNWSNNNPPVGGSSFGTLRMFPYSSTNLTSRPFVMVGRESDESAISMSRARFDTLGNFGGPFDMQSDAVMRTVLLSGGECIQDGVDVADITGTTWQAFRTSAVVETGANAERTLARLGVKLTFGKGTSDIYGVKWITGAWADDGDGVAESGELLCTGFLFTSIPVG